MSAQTEEQTDAVLRACVQRFLTRVEDEQKGQLVYAFYCADFCYVKYRHPHLRNGPDIKKVFYSRQCLQTEEGQRNWMSINEVFVPCKHLVLAVRIRRAREGAAPDESRDSLLDDESFRRRFRFGDYVVQALYCI